MNTSPRPLHFDRFIRPAFAGHFAFRFLLVSGIALVVLLGSLVTASKLAQAQDGNPPNRPARGLVYTGLVRSQRNDCRNGYEIRLPNRIAPLCTHGPDPAPRDINLQQSAAPRQESMRVATAVCDGDGQNGNRFQVVYARASDKPDRFPQYANSIQQWAVELDGMMNASAQQTGGERHVRFVHDAACQPVVANVVLSAEADDTFNNLIMAMWNQGYSRSDRNYLVFMDANVYCGIGTITTDDSRGIGNAHNAGPYYSRIDAGCWNAANAGHELMHNLGGVQPSAPHGTIAYHCYDDYDRMCYRDAGSVVMQYLCDSGNEYAFDCNHDDYFHTNPAPDSYLGTHWNSADNVFLIRPTSPQEPTPVPTLAPTLTPTPPPTATPVVASGKIKVDTLKTGKANRKNKFVATSTFKPGETVWLKGHAKNQAGAHLAGVVVSIQIIRPDGANQCSSSVTSDASGNFSTTCALLANAPTGQWQAKINSLDKSGYGTDPASILKRAFTVNQ